MTKLNSERITKNLSQLIQIPTVSSMDKSLIDQSLFDDFKKILDQLFPKVTQVAEKKLIPPNGLLYKWKGKKSDKPLVLMSHFDVVPAEASSWDIPPFSGELQDGSIWGRGTLDTKATLLGVMEAAETLLEEDFVPEQDIYFSFGGDEEVSGESTPNIVSYLRESGITPYLVIDEGGAVVEGVFPGVTKPIAFVGVGEKGTVSLNITIKSSGGHASAPPVESTVGKIAKAIIRLEKKGFKAHLTAPIVELFKAAGQHASFPLRLIFKHSKLFKPLLLSLFKKRGGQMAALVRTTIAFTRMNGSKAYNVMPPVASFGLNLRLLNTDTIETAVAHVQEIIGSEFSIEIIDGGEASKISPSKGQQWELLSTVIKKQWPKAIVSPYLMVAASDSRHYTAISDYVYRFSAMQMTNDEIGLIHSNNERIQLDRLYETVSFYIDLIKEYR